MYELQYSMPSSVNDAVAEIKKSSEAKFLAGGMTLIPTLKARLSSADMLVDLKGTNLSNVSVSSSEVVIGSMTRHCDVALSSEVISSLPALAKLAGGIGDHMVRSCGTIGGSLANNDPAACYPSAVLALDATIITNERAIAAEDFFVGMFETALNENEIITEVKFPTPEKASYIKFPNPASRYAMVGVFIAKKTTGVAVAVTGAGENGVFRCSEIENALNSSFNVGSIDNVEISPDGLNNDIHASASYRANLIKEMAKRAFNEMI
jgi:carbon-monoxide dehydrogenase medium subunit